MALQTRENVTMNVPPSGEANAIGLLHGCVNYWSSQIDLAEKARAPWKVVADQCQTFYAGTAMNFWNAEFLNKYVGKGIAAPKFQVWIAKAFEFVAQMGPQVFWKNPKRSMLSNDFMRQSVDPMELVAAGVIDEQMAQQMAQDEQVRQVQNQARMQLFESILNYMQEEMPGGGGGAHAELSTMEAMVKGRGMLVARPYTIPGSDRKMTAMVHRSVDHLFTDPDAEDPNLTDSSWIAIRNVTMYRELEKRFDLPSGSLRSAATVNSADWNGSKQTIVHPAEGDRNCADMVVWYEVFSRRGLGMHHYSSPIQDKLEKLTGKFCYLAICPAVHYPLNAAPNSLINLSDQEVGQRFEWPFPCWRAGKFPIALLDFYQVPRSAWPLPPLAMCLGELVALNVLVSALVTRGYTSAQEIIGVLKEAESDLEAKLGSAQSPAIIKIKGDIAKSVADVISFIQRPDIADTTITAINMLMELIDKRTGLVPHVYGASPTQDRSAMTTQSKDERSSIRPEYMRKKCGDFLREAGDVEKCLSGWTLEGSDVEPILGTAGAIAWEALITNADPDLYLLDLKCHVEVADMQRPDKQHMQNAVQLMNQTVLPILERYAQTTLNYEPVNQYIEMLGETNEIDLSGVMIPPPQPPEESVPPEQKAMMEAQAREAEATAAQAELAVQNAQQQLEFSFDDHAAAQEQAQIDMAAKEQEIQLASESAAIDNLVKLSDTQIKAQTARATTQIKQQQANKPTPKPAAKR